MTGALCAFVCATCPLCAAFHWVAAQLEVRSIVCALVGVVCVCVCACVCVRACVCVMENSLWVWFEGWGGD